MPLLKKPLINSILSLSTWGTLSLLHPGISHAQAKDPICPKNPGAAGLANKEAFGSSGKFNGFAEAHPVCMEFPFIKWVLYK